MLIGAVDLLQNITHDYNTVVSIQQVTLRGLEVSGVHTTLTLLI